MGLLFEVNVLENFLKQSWSSSEMICWTVSQPHSPENHLVKFLSQPCSFFILIHVMHSHLIYRLPGAYECIMPFQSFLYQYIKYAYIPKFTITPHVIQFLSTITQTNSLGLNTISSPMAYTHNYIPYNCDIMLTHQAYALTY